MGFHKSVVELTGHAQTKLKPTLKRGQPYSDT